MKPSPSVDLKTATSRLGVQLFTHPAVPLRVAVVLACVGSLCFGTQRACGSSHASSVALAGSWTETGSLASPHTYHTATLLRNGKVLVAGGFNVQTFHTIDT